MPRATFRPFVKSIVLTHEAVGGVHFTDLNGSSMNASYVQVAALQGAISAEDEGWFSVEPSGLVKTGYNITASATLPGVTNASAMAMGGPNQPIVELSLPQGNTIDSVKISNALTVETTFIVTYGHIKPANDLGDASILADGGY